MKDFLEEGGFEVKSSRMTIKTAFQVQLIDDGHGWIDALEKRNLMAHTYDEEKANEAEELIRKKYYKNIKQLCSKLEELR
jgi:nucleotidyltransferase substrate binding protein (TIGR01987 family)